MIEVLNRLYYALSKIYQNTDFLRPIFPVSGQNCRFFTKTGKYGSEKTHILVYVTQYLPLELQILGKPII